MSKWKTTISRMAVSAVAIAALASLVTYETAKPMAARASVAAAAAPLDDNSVSALLSLDQAMETLAARVTPAIVNVAVTSKSKPDAAAQQEIPDDMQQFFGPGFGQGFGLQFQILILSGNTRVTDQHTESLCGAAFLSKLIDAGAD